ncbi:hypothetical protein CYMTET_26140 [Cymbomonas tetramitiformis]|uniref:DDE-1 domain-containing protein n=1 Tax=Cymbomonas tetramitiformis TaxID=36881 RepID=A0AAE0FT69_9CHLO|nr:hypothetical protein CYMTET_26140 [Cymbomonas tetramitiformis]
MLFRTKWAAQAVKNGVISSREASTRVLQKYGVQLHFSTICKAAAKLKVVTPEKPGRKSFIPPHAEKDLWEFICALRAMKVPVYKQTVCSYANELIAGTSIEDLFAHGVVDNNWYYGFLDRFHMKTGNARPLELQRGKWCTTANMKAHYDVVAHALVDGNLAVWNPDWVEDDPDSCMVHITKPDRLFSSDETRLTMDCTDRSKSRQERIVNTGKDDGGEVLVNKGGGAGTGVGGSFANGHSTPPLFIFGGTDTYDAHWTVGAPRSTIVDPTGRGYPATFSANKKDGMNHALSLQYLRRILWRCCFRIAVHTPQNPIGVICDGHGSHLSCELLSYCREVGVIVLLRPPHTTSISQGEDVVNFSKLKPLFRTAKARRLLAKLDETRSPYLSMADMMVCVAPGWMEAFNEENNRKAWAAIGIQPFTRRRCHVRDKGPMTCDASFAVVEEASRKKQAAAEDTLSRKREAAVKELVKAGKYAKLAEGARAKLHVARNHVQHSKLVKDELLGILRAMGQTPASCARKGDLELQLQELLGQPGKNGPCGYIF